MDFILTSMNGVITPLVIEVNAHDCLYASSLYESSDKEVRGQATRTLVQTMIARSQRFLMKNKVVLVLGTGGFANRTLWKDAQDFGVKVGGKSSLTEFFLLRNSTRQPFLQPSR